MASNKTDSSMALPPTMRATQWTTLPISNGLDKALKYNPSAPLPKYASALPPNSALVRVAYVSLNPIDYKVPESSVARFILPAPGIPGMDFSGTVVTSTRSDLKPGTRVFGSVQPPAFGSLAEYVVLPNVDGCIALPDGVELQQAACVGVAGLTAYQCLVPYARGSSGGGRVLINGGSGGAGSWGIQVAKAAGYEVTTTCSTGNVALCKEMGADEVLDYRSLDVVETLREQAAKGAPQFDLIVDNVFASHELYFNAHHFLRPGGVFLSIAGAPTMATMYALLKAYLLPGFLGGGKRPFKFLAAKQKTEDYQQLAQWMREGKIKIPIEEVIDLEEADKAFAKLKSGRTKGKLVVKVCGDA